MKIIGIDPGLSGAVAILTDKLELIQTPTKTVIKSGGKKKSVYLIGEMADIIHKHECLSVFIESVHSMPGQGVSSMFSMGFGFGVWMGIIHAYGIKPIEVTPQAWKKKLLPDYVKEKASSCYLAQELFPDNNFFTSRGRAIDGFGDAALIAYYGKLMLHGS